MRDSSDPLPSESPSRERRARLRNSHQLDYYCNNWGMSGGPQSAHTEAKASFQYVLGEVVWCRLFVLKEFFVKGQNHSLIKGAGERAICCFVVPH
ncbi:hypothetical protein Ddc_02610 [Ditylenchus destructor]|nr:hypothetical protein Ddc_02610 [Ditylenchus destructor]